MIKLFIVIFSLAALTGCAAAEIVDATGSPKVGVVRYSSGYFVKEKSHNIALEKMEQYCGGAYKIINEEFNPDVFSVSFADNHYSSKDNYMFIKFECAK